MSSKINVSGSANLAEPEFLLIGWIGRPHGVRGEVRFHVLTDFPDRLQEGLGVYIGDSKVFHEIVSARGNPDKLLLGFHGLHDRNEAGLLRNQQVFVRSDQIPALPAGEYYQHQLLGMSVLTEDGKQLGMLKEILLTGANDVFLIEDLDSKEILLPVIDEVILSVNLEENIILVRLPEGL